MHLEVKKEGQDAQEVIWGLPQVTRMHQWCIVRRGGNLGEIVFLDLRVFKTTLKKVDLGARSLKGSVMVES